MTCRMAIRGIGLVGGFGCGNQAALNALRDGGRPNDVLSFQTAIALSGGYLFFVGFTAVSVWILSRFLLIPRLTIITLSMILVFLSIGQPAYIALIILALSLVILTFIEWKKCRHA